MPRAQNARRIAFITLQVAKVIAEKRAKKGKGKKGKGDEGGAKIELDLILLIFGGD